MRIHNKTIRSSKIQAYNDSNVDWVICSNTHTTQRFPKNKWTLKDAIAFYVELNKI